MPPCWAAAEYDGAVRAVLLEYKEHDRRAAVPVLARALARAVGAAAPRGPVVLVPVPSSPAAVRARGGDHVYRLARAASGDLRRSGWSPRVARLLGAARTRRDSAGLDAGERRANLAGAFRPRRGSERLAEALGGPFVLVDDLVTTGATLTEAARTLRTFCVDAVHAAVIAATVRRVSITACRASRHALTRTGGDETPPSG
jgi:predicted amidophosphoribosyltransferase